MGGIKAGGDTPAGSALQGEAPAPVGRDGGTNAPPRRAVSKGGHGGFKGGRTPADHCRILFDPIKDEQYDIDAGAMLCETALRELQPENQARASRSGKCVRPRGAESVWRDRDTAAIRAQGLHRTRKMGIKTAEGRVHKRHIDGVRTDMDVDKRAIMTVDLRLRKQARQDFAACRRLLIEDKVRSGAVCGSCQQPGPGGWFEHGLTGINTGRQDSQGCKRGRRRELVLTNLFAGPDGLGRTGIRHRLQAKEERQRRVEQA